MEEEEGYGIVSLFLYRYPREPHDLFPASLPLFLTASHFFILFSQLSAPNVSFRPASILPFPLKSRVVHLASFLVAFSLLPYYLSAVVGPTLSAHAHHTPQGSVTSTYPCRGLGPSRPRALKSSPIAAFYMPYPTAARSGDLTPPLLIAGSNPLLQKTFVRRHPELCTSVCHARRGWRGSRPLAESVGEGSRKQVFDPATPPFVFFCFANEQNQRTRPGFGGWTLSLRLIEF